MAKEIIWDNLKALDKLEGRREKQRKKLGWLTYDCFYARCREDRVICHKGKCLARGDMSLLSVLRGRTASVCKSCLSFDG